MGTRKSIARADLPAPECPCAACNQVRAPISLLHSLGLRAPSPALYCRAHKHRVHKRHELWCMPSMLVPSMCQGLQLGNAGQNVTKAWNAGLSCLLKFHAGTTCMCCWWNTASGAHVAPRSPAAPGKSQQETARCCLRARCRVTRHVGRPATRQNRPAGGSGRPQNSLLLYRDAVRVM